jgi:hypothetical protein
VQGSQVLGVVDRLGGRLAGPDAPGELGVDAEAQRRAGACRVAAVAAGAGRVAVGPRGSARRERGGQRERGGGS